MSLNKFTIQKSFAINAGAGSGKTYTLSRRYINALLGFDFFKELGFDELYFDNLKPARVKEIATITYTEAAALEMKERIFALISKIINFENLPNTNRDYESIQTSLNSLNDKQKEYVQTTLQKALKDSSNAKISTIHSFCMDLIKANLDIAKFDGNFDVAKDYEKEVFLANAIFEVLNDTINKPIITSLAQNLNLFLLNSLFQKYAISSKFRCDFESFTKKSLSVMDLKNIIKDLFTLPDTASAVANIISYFHQNNFSQNYIELIVEYPQRFNDFEAISFKELSEAKNAPINLQKKEFKGIKKEIKELRELDNYISQYKMIDEQKENDFYTKIDELKTLMRQIKQSYDAKLQDEQKIDFDEIIQKASILAPLVPKTIKYMMVDEFQDTNELQYQIVKDSLSPNSNLFVVGDSKQSIYSFQGAQIEVFNDALEDKSKISSVEPMDINYRSDGVLLDNVNKIFEHILKPDESIKAIKQNYEATFQKLNVSKEEKKESGSFNFLITAKDKTNDDEDEEDGDELENLANFIANIKYGLFYPHINKKIANNKKAIAIIFDSSTKMLELKNLLEAKNIQVKVSASENFFHSIEITDLFHLLQAIEIANKKSQLNFYDKYYLAGAYRSCILKYCDNEIRNMLQNNIISKELKELAHILSAKTLPELLMHIFTNFSLDAIYEHLGNKEQRIANFYKFLQIANDFETSSNNDIKLFLKTIQNNIFFNEHTEAEALFQSDSLESIEICTIHSTKGLAYPMVILANAQKGLYGQIQSDTIKHNNFTLSNGEKKEIAGFKIGDYEPLSFRVLKKIDKLKHIAEKKRLFYVALTRAEHDIVISAKLSKSKSDGHISLREDSYLAMICEGQNISKVDLFDQNLPNSIANLPKLSIEKAIPIPQNNEIVLKELTFANQNTISATMNPENWTFDKTKAKLGTAVHKIFELYSKNIDSIDLNNVYQKFGIVEEVEQEKIKTAITNFKNTDAYKAILNGSKHYFELEFHDEEKRGFIDLVYFDKEKDGWVIADFKTGNKSDEVELKYQSQLNFYEKVLLECDLNVVKKEILWV